MTAVFFVSKGDESDAVWNPDSCRRVSFVVSGPRGQRSGGDQSPGGGAPRSYELNLSFLDGGRYAAVLLEDDPERSDNLVRRETLVQASSSICVRMNASGGFVAMFKPAN